VISPPDPATALLGARVVVPVTAQRRELAERLREHGAIAIEAELIVIAPTSDPGALVAAAQQWCAGAYDWMAVTSRNAVAALARVARASGLGIGSVPYPVATVGEASRRACAEHGLTIGLVPSREDARGIVDAFPEGSGRVLAPLGNLASSVLPEGLRAKGWEVDVIEAYRTVDGPGLSVEARTSLVDGTADAVILTSASVAQRLRRDMDDLPLHTHVKVVAIGETTARAATDVGLRPSVVSAMPTYDGILEALAVVLEEPT
jgi:uroporphyrinogen-III synthase